MSPEQLAALIGTAVGAAVAASGAVAVRMRNASRTRSLPPPPAKGGDDRRSSLGEAADLALIRELLVEVHRAIAEDASHRARDHLTREVIARMAETIEQIYYRHDRRFADIERHVRSVEVTLEEVLKVLRRRQSDE